MKLVLYVAQWLNVAGLNRASEAISKLNARFVFELDLKLDFMNLKLWFIALKLDL